MGFSSFNDFLSELTANAKFWRADFMKGSGANAFTAGRWYDLLYFDGYPQIHVHGDFITNGGFWGSATGWTLGGQWAYTPASGLVTRTVGGSTDSIDQNTACVQGTTYSVAYTLAGYTGSGSFQVSLGGTAGTARAANGTYRESIVCGATSNAPLSISGASTVGGTIDNVSVTEVKAFKPYSDADQHQLYHGGNVSTDTKHILNMGAWTNAATGAPSVLMLVDLLGCYPRIDLNVNTSQTLTNTATLPRYTDGKGVRAFLSVSEAPGATPANLVMSYTNPGSTSGRGLVAVVALTVSAIAGHILHSGTAASNFGPFLPLAAGDAGVKSVQSVQLSAAMAAGSGAIGNLVLCKPLATLPLTTAFQAAERDLLNQLPSLPQIVDGACLGFLLFAGAAVAANTQFQGYVDLGWG
jgi:hypothetical protein